MYAFFSGTSDGRARLESIWRCVTSAIVATVVERIPHGASAVMVYSVADIDSGVDEFALFIAFVAHRGLIIRSHLWRLLRAGLGHRETPSQATRGAGIAA